MRWCCVVAGQMGVTLSNIMPYKGTLTESQESSFRLSSGIYSQTKNPMSSCDGTTILYHGVLVCLNTVGDDGNYFGIQFYFSGDSAKKYSRVIEYNTLGAWVEL